MALLEGLLRSIELLSLPLCVGGFAFFSFIATPIVNRSHIYRTFHRRAGVAAQGKNFEVVDVI